VVISKVEIPPKEDRMRSTARDVIVFFTVDDHIGVLQRNPASELVVRELIIRGYDGRIFPRNHLGFETAGKIVVAIFDVEVGVKPRFTQQAIPFWANGVAYAGIRVSKADLPVFRRFGGKWAFERCISDVIHIATDLANMEPAPR
jgi:hypothetical protein